MELLEPLRTRVEYWAFTQHPVEFSVFEIRSQAHGPRSMHPMHPSKGVHAPLFGATSDSENAAEHSFHHASDSISCIPMHPSHASRFTSQSHAPRCTPLNLMHPDAPLKLMHPEWPDAPLSTQAHAPRCTPFKLMQPYAPLSISSIATLLF
jgi:hypothetical protein